MQEKISIIVPAYNVQNYIEKCVMSIIKQTYKNIEIIIINDGSTDNTYKICKRLTFLDSRIKLLHQKNIGVAAARNEGIKICNGEWIVFVDADDWLEPNAIKQMYSNIEKTNAQLVICSYYEDLYDKSRQISEATNKLYIYDMEKDSTQIFGLCILSSSEWPELFPKKYLSGLNLRSPFAKLYNTQVIRCNKILFNENLKLAEDQDFNLQYLNKIKKICYIDSPLYHYLIHEGSASHSNEQIIEKHQISNQILYSRIRAIAKEDELELYWNAHLVESVLIITRRISYEKISLNDYMKILKKLKSYINEENIKNALNYICRVPIKQYKKRYILVLYRFGFYYAVGFMYRFLR